MQAVMPNQVCYFDYIPLKSKIVDTVPFLSKVSVAKTVIENNLLGSSGASSNTSSLNEKKVVLKSDMNYGTNIKVSSTVSENIIDKYIDWNVTCTYVSFLPYSSKILLETNHFSLPDKILRIKQMLSTKTSGVSPSLVSKMLQITNSEAIEILKGSSNFYKSLLYSSGGENLFINNNIKEIILDFWRFFRYISEKKYKYV